MMPENEILRTLIAYGYWVAVPMMIVEGPITTILMAFFASFGYFNPMIVLTFSFFSDLISDTVFYLLGYYNGDHAVRRFGKYLGIRPDTLESVRGFYERHGGLSIFFAKIMTGIVPPVFIVAGYSRMSLRRFYGYAALGGILWSAGLVTLGYYFGQQFRGDFRNVRLLFNVSGLFLFALLSLFVIYRIYGARLIKRSLRFRGTSKPR